MIDRFSQNSNSLANIDMVIFLRQMQFDGKANER